MSSPEGTSAVNIPLPPSRVPSLWAPFTNPRGHSQASDSESSSGVSRDMFTVRRVDEIFEKTTSSVVSPSEDDSDIASPRVNPPPLRTRARRRATLKKGVRRPATTTATQNEHFLGLLKATLAEYAAPQFDDDYEKQLPEDEYGEEAGPNARVWCAYEQEAAAYDAAMVGQSRDGLDVMLVFAGLFSAVVTSFLVQVSQNLQPDYSEMTALLLHDLVVTQIQAGEASAANITSPSADPSAEFVPDTLDVWVNALWAISLTASLVVALSAVLVKQWLHRYTTPPSGTPGLRSHIRQFRFDGFEEWHVEAIIGTLPIILHLSLGLFFVGLIIFYIPLRSALAWIISGISAVVLVLYLTSNMLPRFHPRCPYQTPLTDFFPYLIQTTISMGLHLISSTPISTVLVLAEAVRHAISSVWRAVGNTEFIMRARRIWERSTFARVVSRTSTSIRRTLVIRIQAVRRALMPARKRLTEFTSAILIPMPARERESRAVQRGYDEISIDALHWVFHMSANPTLHRVVIESIAGLPYEVKEYALLKWGNDDRLRDTWWISFLRSSTTDFMSVDHCSPGQESVVERLCRLSIFLPHSIVALARRFEIDLSSPRLAAASALLQDAPFWATGTGVLDVFRSIRTELLPANLWSGLVLKTLECVFKHSTEPTMMDLLIILLPRDGILSLGGTFMTLDTAVESEPIRHDMFTFLLENWVPQHTAMSYVFGVELSVELRVIVAVWKYAVHHLSHRNALPDVDVGSTALSDLLEISLNYIFFWISQQQPFLPTTSAPHLELLEDLLESVLDPACPVCTSLDLMPHDFDTNDVRYSSFLRVQDIYERLSGRAPAFKFPSFRRMVEAGIRRLILLSIYFSDASNTQMYSKHTWRILTRGLRRGLPDAFEVFVEFRFPQLLCEVIFTSWWSGEGPNITLRDIILGLERLTEEQRRRYMESIHHDRRNLLAICIWALFTFAHDADCASLSVMLPDHPSWPSVISKLMALQKWSRSAGGLGVVEGSIPLLDFSGGPSIQGSVQEIEGISLGDAMRNRLVDDSRVRQRLDDLLEILTRSVRVV